MSWGLWKKFKKGIKKAGMWLKDKLGKAAKFAGKIKPELAKHRILQIGKPVVIKVGAKNW